MRRDMDLVRLLLLKAEGHEKVKLKGFTKKQQLYHQAKLIEAKLLAGHVYHNPDTWQVEDVMVWDVTWAGHDFLAAARSDSVWSKARAKLKSLGGDASLSLMKELLTSIAKRPPRLAP